MGMRDVREGLAARLRTIDRWTAYDGVVANPLCPALMIQRRGGPPRNAYGKKSTEYRFTILAVASLQDLDSAQRWMEDLAERGTATSLYDAIDGDKTLGGTAQTLVYDEEDSGDEPIEIGETTYFGARFFVTVIPAIA